MHYIPAVKQLYYSSWIVVLSFYLSLLRVIEKWSQLRHRAKIDVDFGPCLYQSDLTLQLFICVMAVFRSSWHGAAGMLLQHQEDSFSVSFLSQRIYSLRQTDRQSGGSKRQISHFPAGSCQNCQLSCVRPQHKSHFSWHCLVRPQGTLSLSIPAPSGTATSSRTVWWTAMVFLPVEWEFWKCQTWRLLLLIRKSKDIASKASSAPEVSLLQPGDVGAALHPPPRAVPVPLLCCQEQGLWRIREHQKSWEGHLGQICWHLPCSSGSREDEWGREDDEEKQGGWGQAHP